MTDKKIIFGSTALKFWYPDLPRNPSDLDIISKEEMMSREVQHYWFDGFEELVKLNNGSEYLLPDLLISLKAAHANWNIHWEKTMFDVQFLKGKGHKIDIPLYKHLVGVFRKIHGKESASLKGRTADQFFDDAVKRKYNHDDLHRWVAYYDKPLYESIQPDPTTVECAEVLFKKLSYEDQIKMAKEEIFVTALERFIIPKLPYSQGRAYNASLKKFVTTMSKNWMSLFLIENFGELQYDKKDDYIGRFNKNKNKIEK